MILDWIDNHIMWVFSGILAICVLAIVLLAVFGDFENTECNTGIGTNLTNGQPVMVTTCYEVPER